MPLEVERREPEALSDDLVSVREAAAIAGVGEKAIYVWCKKGVIRSVRSPGGGRIRVYRQDLVWRPRAAS